MRKQNKMKQKSIGFFVVLMALVLLGCPNPAADNPTDQTITLLAIPGVVAPVRGATPVTTAIDTVQYTGTIVWSPTDNPFAPTTAYTATIELTAKLGWTLAGVEADSFAVAGATATNAANSGTVASVFPATGAPADQTITLLAIPSVVAPVRGATPVATAIDMDQYTGTITWFPTDNPFAPTTVYTATIVMTAKAGWTFNGVAANSFTVSGAASAIYSVNSGVVTAQFPATGAPPADVDVTFSSATQVGGISNSVSTTSLTLTFSVDPTTLAASDITLTGATKGALSGTGLTRSLAITDMKVANGETVSVSVGSPVGFAVTGSPQSAVVYMAPTAVTFSSAVQVGGTSDSVTTTGLTLTFSVDPATLAASDITVTGATKGALSGTGLTRSLAISAISVANGATVSVAVASPTGYTITGSPLTAVVYKAPIVVTLMAIPGITAPVFGAIQVTTITETTQYTGTVSWSPYATATTFTGPKVYTAYIHLTAKAGYTLSGVAANSFTVAGATATNLINATLVSAVFPSTSFTLTMINIPSGRFQRNFTSTNISVITQAYRMSQHEITRTQFKYIMGTDPTSASYTSGTDDPVQRTNWYHAIAFCNKLSMAEGLTQVYSVTGVDFTTLTYAAIPTSDNASWNNATADWNANGYRLPTEMEWMWAAMGAPADGQSGGTNTTGYNKAFAGSTGSNAIGDYAVFGYWSSDVGRTTTERTNPVGSKLANELGLYDMSGNVWEWCWDWNNTYPIGTLTDYRGAASGTNRVTRGNGFSPEAGTCTLDIKISKSPYSQTNEYGFRVVRP